MCRRENEVICILFCFGVLVLHHASKRMNNAGEEAEQIAGGS